MSAPCQTVGYVVRMFPQLSETFVAGEILEIERRGVPLHVFSYRRPTATVEHEVVRAIESPVTYLPDPLFRHAPRLLAAQPSAAWADSRRYRDTLRYVLGYTWRERNPDTWRRFLQAVFLARLVRERQIGHLHAHFAHGATRVAMLVSRLTGIPFSFSAHARDIYTNEPHVLRERVRAASFVSTCTRANVEYLRSLLPEEDRDKVHLDYHGIDVTKFAPRPRLATGPPRILAVGRLVAKKGLETLVEACARLREEGSTFHCRIVGAGPERERLQREIDARSLGRHVELAGKMTQEQVLEEYRSATLFALPCRVLDDGDRDGIPNVLVEAMAVGLPVVSTRVSGIPELVTDGHDGRLVEPRDPAGLASALAELLHSSDLRRLYGEHAQETVMSRFDRRRNVDGLVERFGRPVEADASSPSAPALERPVVASTITRP